MGAWTYRGYPAKVASARHDAKTTAPVIVRLRGWLGSVDPHGFSLGTLALRPVRGGTAPSVHRTGRVIDWQPSSPARGDELFAILTEYPDGADVQLVIWRDLQWGGRAGPGVRKYTGSAGYHTHLHVESRSWA